MFKIDGFVKSPLGPFIVIPAKAGIQSFQAIMDSCLRRNDTIFDFLRFRQNLKKPLLGPKVRFWLFVFWSFEFFSSFKIRISNFPSLQSGSNISNKATLHMTNKINRIYETTH
jgi:hypothetical protein